MIYGCIQPTQKPWRYGMGIQYGNMVVFMDKFVGQLKSNMSQKPITAL